MIAFLRRLFGREPHAKTRKQAVFDILRRDYGRSDVLPHGAMARVAHEAGCTRQYVSQVARHYKWRAAKGES